MQVYLSEFSVKTHRSFKNILRTDISEPLWGSLVVWYPVGPPGRVLPGYLMDGSSTHWITRKQTLAGISQWVFSQNSLQLQKYLNNRYLLMTLLFLSCFYLVDPPGRVFPCYLVDGSCTYWIRRKGTLPCICQWEISQNSLKIQKYFKDSYLSSTLRFLSCFLLYRSSWKSISWYPTGGSSTNWITRKRTLPGMSHWVFSQQSLKLQKYL